MLFGLRTQLMLMIMRGVVDQMVYQGFGIQDFMKVKTMDGLVLLT